MVSEESATLGAPWRRDHPACMFSHINHGNMPSISNAGGSLTSALILTLLAWGVRWLRAELNKKKRDEASTEQSCCRLGRFYAKLSPSSLRMLVEHGVHPHLVFDVRRAPTEPLPSELKGALGLPGDRVDLLLGSEQAWHESFQGVPYPAPHLMLVFVGDSEEEQLLAAAKAAAHGYQRTMVLEGCLRNFLPGIQAQLDLRYIDREAVALLLAESASAGGAAVAGSIPGVVWEQELPRALVIDVRRSDERALYGAIRGSLHVPLDQLPSALMLDSEHFVRLYSFRKPTQDDLLVMSSRTNNRSAWAAQVAKDAGLQRCLVHRQGVYGWHFDPSVLPYRRYSMLDAPPDPEPFQVDEVDVDVGQLQLVQLGLL